MFRLLTLKPFVCGLLLLCASLPLAAQTVHPGKTGTELENLIRTGFHPTTSLGYTEAKEKMFTIVDNNGGQIRLIYSGDTFPSSTVPSANIVNAEHIWPQSRFGSNVGGKKSDLHHLFPCYSKINSSRSNNRFAEIPDATTTKWWKSPTALNGIPGSDIDSYSEATNGAFEPREADKGNVARAMFYFRAVYGNTGIELPFFEQQKSTLLAWHQADPADADEKMRNDRVAAVQGNRNPFIDDATLAVRTYNPSVIVAGAPGAPAAPGASTNPQVPPQAGTVTLQDGAEYHIMTWNLRWFFDADKSDNQSMLAKNESADTDAEYQARLKKIAKVIHDSGKPDIVALQEIENQKVVQQLADEMNATFQVAYKVGFVQGTDTFTEQDVAFLYKDFAGAEVNFARIPEAGFNNPTLFKMPSKHCVMSVKHTLPNGVVKKLSIVNCHLKAGGGSDEDQRKKQGRVISTFVNQQLTADPTQGVIVLGDMNAGKRFDQTTANDGIGVLRGMETMSPLDDLTDLHADLLPAQRNTHVSNRELDRILVSGALVDDIGFSFRQIVVRKDLVTTESDHYPLIATFSFNATIQP